MRARGPSEFVPEKISGEDSNPGPGIAPDKWRHCVPILKGLIHEQHDQNYRLGCLWLNKLKYPSIKKGYFREILKGIRITPKLTTPIDQIHAPAACGLWRAGPGAPSFWVRIAFSHFCGTDSLRSPRGVYVLVL